jgi:glycosyltransferase involved in cell wall biosynthesis
MKIALYNLTTTIKQGGIETFNWEMARALSKRNHSVHIYGGKGEIIPEVSDGVSVHTFPFLKRELIPDFGSRFRKFMERLSFGLFSLRHLISRRYDYIYVSKPFDIPVVLLASFFSKAKVVFGSGGTEFFPGYSCLVKNVDYFFSCSVFNASQIEQYCGVRPLVLPNGINTDLFKPQTADHELKKSLDLADSDKVIISVCRLIGLKGINYAIKAVARLIKKGHPIKYVIIGEGAERQKLESLAKELDIADNIEFLGNKKNAELPRYYSVADLAIFPSIASETFGISAAEAMACGVAVISTTVGGIPEVVSEGTGLLTPPRDEDALTKAVEKLIADDPLRKKMGMRGREWVMKKYGWDGIVNAFEEYIHDVR